MTGASVSIWPSVLIQRGETSACASLRAWTSRSGPLGSIRIRSQASRNPGTIRAARRASSIRVPSPGPTSTSLNRSGAPSLRQVSTAHRPISSPNIWLIKGAVMKSPPAPSAGRVA